MSIITFQISSGLKISRDGSEIPGRIINYKGHDASSRHRTLKGIHVAWDQFQDDTKTLEQIQDVAKSAKGRNQIEQAGNQLLGFLGEELMRLRQMAMMQAQMAGVALEAERAKEDARQKRLEAFFKPASPSDVKGPAFESLADLF